MESYKMFKPEKADRGRATHTHTQKNKKTRAIRRKQL